MIASARLIVATTPSIAEVAAPMLTRGNAVDAIAAGVFAACAHSPATLFGPVQILVVGAGAGLRAIDGRTRQPGLGALRPRGFLLTESIPLAAHVATPCLPAAVAVALATYGSCTFAHALGPAIDLARTVSEARHRFLKSLARGGPSVLASTAVASELLVVGGKLAGGILTREDLEKIRPCVEPPITQEEGSYVLATVPWGARAVRGGGDEWVDAGSTEIIAASDDHGMLAIACFESPLEGVAVDELGVVIPLTAAPVRRGERRVQPGVARPAAAPILLRQHNGWPDLALGTVGRGVAECDLFAMVREINRQSTIDDAFAAYGSSQNQRKLHDTSPTIESRQALGIARSRRSARRLRTG